MRLPGVLGVGLTLPAALADLGSLVLIGGLSGAPCERAAPQGMHQRLQTSDLV
jgi:hypothetical protein